MKIELFFILTVILVIGLNLLWYNIKGTLKEKGYEVSYFWRHGADIVNLVKLIKCTEDSDKRRSYQLMLWFLILGIVLFVGLALLAFINKSKWI
ncbi:MAG: hypothetical protein ABFS32_22800 [Bacteroidota bacterium]